MQRIRNQFTETIRLSAEQVRAAKDYFAEAVVEPTDGAALISQWWKMRKAPPVVELILDEDYGFTDACGRAARYWENRLSAAQALKELVIEGYVDRVGDWAPTEQINQGYTTVTSESRSGNSGGWSLAQFGVQYPGKVTKGPFAKKWTPLAPANGADEMPPVASELQPLGAIVDPTFRGQAIEALNELEQQLIALVDSGELGQESKTLITEQAYPLIDELKKVLREVATNEHERSGIIRRAAISTGKAFGTLAGAGRLVAGVHVLATLPAVIDDGLKLLGSIEHWIG